MLEYIDGQWFLVGPSGSLQVLEDDEIIKKVAMIYEAECGNLGPSAAAKKFGYCKQRYFQIRKTFLSKGAEALISQKKGPKSNYRRTESIVRQIIRHRFLDPEVSAEVIAQKLSQCGYPISIRSVERVIAEYGIQKKTLSVQAGRCLCGNKADKPHNEG